MIELTISRAGLGLADLTATGEPPAPGASGVWLPEDGIGRPDITWRLGYAPNSSDMHGAVLLSATKEMSSLPLSLYFRADTSAALAALEAEWTAALEQWSYTARLLIDGQGATWSCDPTSPRWGAVDSGEVRAHLSHASVVIPVYPIGA